MITATEEKKAIRGEWFNISDQMLNSLIDAVKKSVSLSDDQKQIWLTSITHQEVLRGILNVPTETVNRHACCFLRDIEEFQGQIKKLIKASDKVKRFIELDSNNEEGNDETMKQLRNMRESIKKKKVTCKDYVVNWQKVGITEETHSKYIEQMGEDFYNEMTTRIQIALDQEPLLDVLSEEVVTHNHFCLKRAETFHGRLNLVDAGLGFFSGQKDSLNQIYVIDGISGSGKTSLMSKLAYSGLTRVAKTYGGSSPVLAIRFCGTTLQSSNARGIMRSICQQIAHAYDTSEEHIPDDYKSLIVCLKEQMSKASTEKPLVICIDSLDQLTDEDQARSQMTWLPMSLPPHVFLVVSTLPNVGGCLQSIQANNLPQTQYLEVAPISISDAKNILEGWLEHSTRALTKSQMETIISIATDSTDEKPTALRLRLLFDIASKCPSYDSVSGLPNTVRGLINRFFQRLEDYHGIMLVSHTFGILGASKHGVSGIDLLDILSADEEVLATVLQYHQPPIRRLPQIVFARLQNDLGEYIVERGTHGKSVLSWYHRQFWEAAEDRYLKPQNGVNYMEKYSKLLAEYFSNNSNHTFPDRRLTPQPDYWQDPTSESCIFNYSRLSELPYTACAANDEQKVKLCLCNLKFIAYKCKAGLGRELLADYYQALSVFKNNSELESYHRFVSGQMYIIEKHPEQVYQQAINMAEDNIVHKAAIDLLQEESSELIPWQKKVNLSLAVYLKKAKGEDPCLMTLEAHSAAVTDLLCLGSMIISSGMDKKVIIWDRLTGECRAIIHCQTGVTKINLLSVDDAKFELAIACQDGKVSIWQVNTGTNVTTNCICEWQAHPGPVDLLTMAASSCGTTLATGFVYRPTEGKTKGEAKMWNIASCRSNGDKVMPIACKDVDGVVPGRILNGVFGVWLLAFSPDNNFVVVGLGEDGSLGGLVSKILSVCIANTLEPLWVQTDKIFRPQWLEVFEPKEQIWGEKNKVWFILMTTNYTISLTAVYTEGSTKAVGHTMWTSHFESGCRSAILAPNRTDVISGFNEQIDIHNKEPEQISDPSMWESESEHTQEPDQMSPGMWEPKYQGIPVTQNALSKLGNLRGHASNVNILCSLMDDGNMCCSGSSDGSIKVWDLDLFLQYHPVDGHAFGAYSCAITPNHRYFITGSDRGRTLGDIKAWEATNGRLICSTAGFSEKITSMAASPTGQLLAFRTATKPSIEFFDIARFRSIGNKCVSSSSVFSVTLSSRADTGWLPFRLIPGSDTLNFSADGSQLLATSIDYSFIFVINVKDRNFQWIKAHKGAVLGGRFSPDGNHIMTWCSAFVNPFKKKDRGGGPQDAIDMDANSQVKLFELSSKEELACVDAHPEECVPIFDSESHAGFSSVAFAEDDSCIITSTHTGLLHIRDRNTLAMQKQVTAHELSISSIRWVSGVSKLVTCSLDKWVKLWSIPDLQEEASFYVGAPVTGVETCIAPSGNIIIYCCDILGHICIAKLIKIH